MKRLSLLLIIAVVAGLLLPLNTGVVTSDTKTSLVLDKGLETTYIGKTLEGNNLWQAVIGSPQYLDDLVTPINCQWQYDLNNTQWYAKDNLFTATVKDGRVTVTYQGKRIDWQPQLEVRAVAQLEGYASLLSNDPMNEYYYGNTLQWDYGNGITRNLRIIEGMLQEYYIIDKLPGGDIIIKTNTNKNIGFNWTRPAVAWDSSTLDNSIDLKINGDTITLTLDTMKETTFPITIDPDLTFTGAEMDATLANTEVGTVSPQQEWNDVRNDTTSSDNWLGPSGTCAVAGKNASGTYTAVCYRPVLYFDTEGLPDDCNITNATLRLRGTDAAVQTEMGIWHMVIQNGQPTYPHEPPVNADYYYTYYSGNGGNISSDDMGTGYKNITLSPTGLTWINKTDVTKFILREEEHDINNTLISYDDGSYNTSQWIFYLYEQGDGYEPELVVYYEASAAPTIITKNATYIAATTARLNSYVTSDGGEPCDVRFQYSTVSGGAGGGLENFSNYTEVDPNSHIDYNDTHIDFGSYDNETAYLYDDKGATYFATDFEHNLEVMLINASSINTYAGCYALTNAVGEMLELLNANETFVWMMTSREISSTEPRLTLAEVYNTGWGDTDYYTAPSFNISHYLTFTKSGTSLTCDIYPNSSRVTPTDTLSITLQADYSFQYVFVASSYNNSEARNMYLEVDNLTLTAGGNWTDTPWVNDTYRQGDSPYVDIANLTSNVTYYFRAQIRNSEGVSSGAERSFTAGISETPTNLTAYPSSHNVSLTWTKGADTTNTMVRGQIGAFPTSETDGQQVYFGTMSTAVHSGLSPGFSYYYRAWGESGGNYTANYTETVTTTSAGVGAADQPDAPPMPSTWFSTPDYTNMADFPLYNMVNDIADDFGMPRNSFWLLSALLIVAIVAIFVYWKTHSIVGGIIAGSILIVVFSLGFGVPLWILFGFGLVATGIGAVVRRT